MTTIAWDGVTLAADQRASSDEGCFQMRKIRRTADGRLLGAAGGAAACSAYLDWLEGDQVSPRPAFQDRADDAVHALEIMPDGEIRRHAHLGWFVVLAVPVAIGSGSGFACGAMAAGKGAVEAVEIACRFDISSRGPVDSLAFHGGKQEKI